MDMKRYLEMGKSSGRSQKNKKLSQQEIESLTPKDLRGKSFDGEKAMAELKDTTHQKVEKYQPVDLDPKIEAMLEKTDRSLEHQDLGAAGDFQETIEKCRVEQIFTPLTLNYTLTVDVNCLPDEVRKIKKCLGHTEDRKSRDPKKDKAKKQKELAADPTIRAYHVSIIKNGLGHRDEVASTWSHKDDVPSCSSYMIEEIPIKGKYDETDRWTVDQPEAINFLDCTLIKTTDGPQESRLINGIEITRPSWEKQQHLQCIKQKSDCDFIKRKNCTFLSESCLEKAGERCLVWEKLFRCRTRFFKDSPGIEGIFGSDSNLWDTAYQENQLFPDVATKLAVFDEMKKELQKPSSKVHLFGGTKQQCSKSIADDIMYDCCVDMDGLAVDLKLSKCTADEIALAESRQKGLAHYIGVRKEKFLDLWVSRKEHVFCIFPTKLSRVFQEEARKQLAISWGSPDKPDCRGLTQEEIKSLDFSKLNLLEVFEPPKEIDSQEKIKKIEDRLKQRLEAVTCK